MSAFINGWTKEKVIAHLEANFKGKAMGKNGLCQYLTEDGRSCAVGMFIPKGDEALYFQGDSQNLLRSYPELIDSLPMNKESLIEFQAIHDRDCSGVVENPNVVAVTSASDDQRSDEEVLADLINYVEGLD